MIKRVAAVTMMLTMVLVLGLFGPVSSIPKASASPIASVNGYRLKDYAIVKKDGLWHVFAINICIFQNVCGPMVYNAGLVHITSPDLSHWTVVDRVLTPDGSGWDADEIWAPSIVQKDNLYYMFYTGVQDFPGAQRIGVATSPDLYTWTRYDGNPVWSAESAPWAYWDLNGSDNLGGDSRDPYVTWDPIENHWVMFYSTRTPDDGNSPPWIVHPMVIGMAISDDLLHWQDRDYLANTKGYVAESSHVFMHNGAYYLFWTKDKWGGSITYATSTNLYGPYTNSNTYPLGGDYASEYFSDNGREYLGVVHTDHLDFHDLVWNGTTLSLPNVNVALLQGTIFYDANQNGVKDAGESGLRNATVSAYLDNGDGLFEPDSGDIFVSTATPGNSWWQADGPYSMSLLPGSYYLVAGASQDPAANIVNGVDAVTTGVIQHITVTAGQHLTQDIGLAGSGKPWFLSDASLVSHPDVRVTSTMATTAETTGWWDRMSRYRRQVTVVAGPSGATTGSVAALDAGLAGLRTAGKIRSDAGDVRLVYDDGTNVRKISLDGLDDVQQRFTLAADIAADASDSNYYLYYGKSSQILPWPQTIIPVANADVSVTPGNEVSLYPVRTGTIQPLSNTAVPFSTFNRLSVEQAEQGGTIRFALSNDAGGHWLYWDGTQWADSDGTGATMNAVSDINDHAASFPTGSGLLLWKASLQSQNDSLPLLLHMAASVGLVPNAPVLIAPEDGGSANSNMPEFRFTATDPDADSLAYELQYDAAPDFSTAALHVVTSLNSSYGWTGLDDCNGQCYTSGSTAAYVPTTELNGPVYWRVRAVDPLGSGSPSAWSATHFFNAPPVLTMSIPTVSVVDSTTAVIRWTSSGPGSSGVWYTSSAGDGDINVPESASAHEIPLTSLQPDTSYSGEAYTVDAYGQWASAAFPSFTTPKSTTVISDVKVETSQNSTVISWTTNDAADSVLQYGKTLPYASTLSDTSKTTSHRLELKNLAPNTVYHFVVRSTGATAVRSADATFQTPRSASIQYPRPIRVYDW